MSRQSETFRQIVEDARVPLRKPLRLPSLVLALTWLAMPFLSGCQSPAVRNTRKAASHNYRGAKTVTRATGKVVTTTAKITRAAIDEIPTWHQVRSGETFLKIAQFYGVPTEELRQLNPLVEPLKLEIGQQLRLRE